MGSPKTTRTPEPRQPPQPGAARVGRRTLLLVLLAVSGFGVADALTRLTDPDPPGMKWVPPGEFVMGSDAGPLDTADFECSVVLRGNRMRDADMSTERLTVRGTLRVIHHPASTINGVEFEAFTEVRVEK